MRAGKVLKTILAKEGITPTEAARKIGRSDAYLSSIIAKDTSPKVSTMAGICDALDYDLLVRSRSDGYELNIDPPE